MMTSTSVVFMSPWVSVGQHQVSHCVADVECMKMNKVVPQEPVLTICLMSHYSASDASLCVKTLWHLDVKRCWVCGSVITGASHSVENHTHQMHVWGLSVGFHISHQIADCYVSVFPPANYSGFCSSFLPGVSCVITPGYIGDYLETLDVRGFHLERVMDDSVTAELNPG